MFRFHATQHVILVLATALCGILCMAAYLLAFSLGRRLHPRLCRPVIGLGELARPLLGGLLLGAAILGLRLHGNPAFLDASLNAASAGAASVGSIVLARGAAPSSMPLGVLLSVVFCGSCAGIWAARPRPDQVESGTAALLQRLCDAGSLTQDATARVAARLALAAGYDPDGAELLLSAAALHDIGKTGLPERVLRKALLPACLDPAEQGLLRTHTRIGFRLLAHSRDPMLELAADIALHHHENWDGTGYPHGLAGDHIPLTSRAVALAEHFDEIMRVPTEIDALVRAVRAHAGTRFDPRLVDLLLDDLPGMIAARGSNAMVRGTSRVAAGRRSAALLPLGAKPIAV